MTFRDRIKALNADPEHRARMEREKAEADRDIANARPEPLWQAVESEPPTESRLAPPGTIWVCAACGKTARDRFNGPGMWDESCMLNSVLCHEPRGSNGNERAQG